MNDQQLVAQLQAIFDANDPADGIDRSDGYGSDYRITGLRIVASDDGFDDLEVSVLRGGRSVTSRVLFDRAWREASGLDDPREYAMFVVARWQHPAAPLPAAPLPAAPHDRSGSDELWAHLLRSLATGSAGVDEVSRGRLEVVAEDGDVVTIHVTPQQWRGFAAGREDAAVDELADLVDSRWDDESHLVFFRGGLHRSIRAELPPVRSMLLRDPLVRGEGS